MKKIAVSLFAALLTIFSLLGFVPSATAAMDDITYSLAVVSTNAQTAAYTIRGTLYAIVVTPPTGATGDVSVASSDGTYLTATAVAAKTIYNPRTPAQSAGGTVTNSVTFFPMANVVTGRVVGGVAAGTNNWTIRVIYDR